MPRLIVPAGELTGSLARARILAAAASAVGGQLIYIESVTIEYELIPLEPLSESVPNIDPFRGYVTAEEPNGEDAHPHDDATGHVTRTHEDFGPRLEKKHITDLPSWGKVGC